MIGIVRSAPSVFVPAILTNPRSRSKNDRCSVSDSASRMPSAIIIAVCAARSFGRAARSCSTSSGVIQRFRGFDLPEKFSGMIDFGSKCTQPFLRALLSSTEKNDSSL